MVKYYLLIERLASALVAQLDRVTGYEPVGRGFESLLAHHVGAKFALLRHFFAKKCHRCAAAGNSGILCSICERGAMSFFAAIQNKDVGES